MPGEPVRVLFCSSDNAFAEMIARTLGSDFQLLSTERFDLDGLDPEERAWDVVLLDLREAVDEAGAGPALRAMDELKQLIGSSPMIAILGDANDSLAHIIIENGAHDTLATPPNIVELRLLLRRAHKFHRIESELNALRTRDGKAGYLDQMLGCTEEMQQVFSMARKVASCDVSVLITGETGTGKELMAQAIHRLSPRANGPFVAFSCANLPETLVDDELFGHEKGAFTGAIGIRRGRFEAANGGTLLLDEIGDLSLGLQAKLLRVLQQRSFERLGSNTPLTTDVRVVCATHRDLEKMVTKGEFRMDLYYRLNVVQIEIPALRERRGEIPVLAQHFLQRFADQFSKPVKKFSPLAMNALEEYAWPGNVRELENAVQRAVVMAEGHTVETWHLPLNLRDGFEQSPVVRSYEDEVREFKRRLIVRTLRECGGSKVETARALGVARGYLHRLINQLQIQLQEGDFEIEGVEEAAAQERVM